MEFMKEILSNLSPIQQFIIVLLYIFNPVSVIAGAFAYLKMRENGKIGAQAEADKLAYATEMNKARERLETLENTQIKIQADAANQQATTDIIREAIANNARSDQRWQEVYDKSSARRQETDERIVNALERNSQSIDDAASIIEVQSANYLIMTDALKRAENASQQATQASEQTLLMVTQKTDTIVREIEALREELAGIRDMQESNIEAQGQRHTDNGIQIARIIEKLGTLEADVSSIRSILTPTPPKPPLELNQPENEEIDKAS